MSGWPLLPPVTVASGPPPCAMKFDWPVLARLAIRLNNLVGVALPTVGEVK